MSNVPVDGPVAWRNWLAALDGRPVAGTLEYAFYTDAGITDEITTGPYFWINTVAGAFTPIVGNAELAIVLRADIHLTDEEFAPLNIDWSKRNTKDYIAGDLDDELAHLGSLALGRRLRSGGLTRRFDVGDDRGTPFEGWHRRPRLSSPEPGHRSILPRVEASANLSHAVELLGIYPTIGLNDARALARASRLYSQALWVADDDPAQAWLRLVSALEAAADRWKAPEKLSLVERLQLADPDLADLVAQAPDHVAELLVAKLAPTVKSTAKFLEFTLAHLPPPPPERPAFGQIEWDEMPAALRTIYEHRSLDLHAGTPFPGPLCAVPMLDDEGVATEKIHSFGVAGQGAVWTEADLPLHLHTFAYIAGAALRGWWAELGKRA